MDANRGESGFRVAASDNDKPLVAALRSWQPATSWSQLRKLIRARRVTVNHALCLDEARRLAVGDTVRLLSESLPPADERCVRIHYSDPYLVIAEKPARMITLRHRAERHWPGQRKAQQPSMDEALSHLLAPHRTSGQRRGGRAAALYPVHRLDRDTSGLLVFARDEGTQRELIARFARHDVDRAYLAIASGPVSAQTVISRLVRDRGDGLRGSTADPEGGRRAVTHLRPLEPLGAYTLVECRLETGRTHQIRIHLAERGQPLCGDTVYRGAFGAEQVPDHSGAPRLALHATRLGFAHPATGEEIGCDAPLPPDLGRFLHSLRTRAGADLA